MYVDDTIDRITEEAVEKSSAKWIAPGSILFVTRSGILRRKLPVGLTKSKVTVNQDIKAFTPVDILPEYAYYYSLSVSEQIRRECAKDGTTVESIDTKKLYNFPVSYPSLPEQRAVVSKLEGLLLALDRSVLELEGARARLGVYRMSVLREAFAGRLTGAWRVENRSSIEININKFIDEAREVEYKNQYDEYEALLREYSKSSGDAKRPRKPRKLDIPNKPTEKHESLKWEIPEQWNWSQLGSIGFVTKLAGFEYTKLVDYIDEGTIPVIKAENAGKRGFKPTKFSRVNKDTVLNLPRTDLKGGELLVTFVGAGTGDVAIVPSDKKYFLGPNIGMVRPYLDVLPKYLQYFFQSPGGHQMILATIKSVAQPSLSMRTIRQAPIALPSLLEQHQIVAEIESRLSVAEVLEREIVVGLERARGLRMGVLKRAFVGGLLTEGELNSISQKRPVPPEAE